ncbi:MAG: DUF3592 domain-containing protein [Hyphomicrobium sp.]|nr:DUF3592 domain-containing protein [Hyphomicrobium sp.]
MPPAQRRRNAFRYTRKAVSFATWLLWIGFIALAIGGYAAWEGHRTLSWPRASAEIIASDVSVVDETRPTQPGAGQPPTSPETAPRAIVAYRYSVDGVAFEGTRLEPWTLGLPSQSIARELAETPLAPGTTVEIAYNPRDARIAYLKPGPSHTALSLAIVGAILFAMGLVMGKITRRA